VPPAEWRAGQLLTDAPVVPACGIILGVSGEPIRQSTCHPVPALPGDAEGHFASAGALAKLVWCCACQLGLCANEAAIGGEDCVTVSPQTFKPPGFAFNTGRPTLTDV